MPLILVKTDWSKQTISLFRLWVVIVLIKWPNIDIIARHMLLLLILNQNLLNFPSMMTAHIMNHEIVILTNLF